LLTRSVESAFIIGVYHRKNSKYDAQESFDEAKSLAGTAGATRVGDEFVEVRQFNPGTFFGSGKVEEIGKKIEILKPRIIIVDYELSPVQNRNLEETWKTRVIDRTGLILDIFAQRARSKEGKLQVELAQLEYLLPRLVGAWAHLKKSQGGIGFRGPGETQLEVDRRRARERIAFLKKNLKRVAVSREIHRAKRQSVPIPTVSLIGYTNAGKSTLFNCLLQAHEFAENKLFATLDPKTKKLRLPSGLNILVSDTVGFIRNLPHQLIESFKSTFEEVGDSELLIHVIDASHPDRAQQTETVERILSELDLAEKPVIKVLNKIDLVNVHHPQGNPSSGTSQGAIEISALNGLGIDRLLAKIEEVLSGMYDKPVHLLIPHHQGKILSEVFTHGRVISTENTDDGTLVLAHLPPKWQNLFADYRHTHT